MMQAAVALVSEMKVEADPRLAAEVAQIVGAGALIERARDMIREEAELDSLRDLERELRVAASRAHRRQSKDLKWLLGQCQRRIAQMRAV